MHLKMNALSSLVNSYVDESLQLELAELQKKLHEEKLYVVVVGLFKRGKSTLINALLGKNILPVGVTPVTALITLIEHAKEPGAEIVFKNRQTELIGIQQVAAYVTEEENPNNIKGVEYVKLFDDAPLLQYAFLIDTPGLGSAYEHNTETTLSFIHKIDAALFLLSADYPISKIDLELLAELQKTAPEIWYILTKADLITKENLQKIIQHNKAIITKELKLPPDKIDFTVVCGTDPGGGGVQPLRDRLMALARKDKSRILQHSSLQQLKRIAQQSLLQLQFRADAYLMPLQDLENRSRELIASIRLMNEQKDEFEAVISGKIRLLKQTINEAVNAESIRLEKIVSQRISEMNTLEKTHLEAGQKEINQTILTSFDEVKNQWEQKAKEHFKSLLQQYSRRSQSFFNELSTHFASYFGQNVDIISEQFDLNAYTSFYLSLDSGLPPLKLSKSFVGGLLPFSVQKQKLQKRWKEHYKEIIVRNTAAIIYDLSYKIQESFRKFNYDLNEKTTQLLSNMQNSIGEVIAAKAREESEREATIKDLANRLDQLKMIQAELTG